MAISLAGSTTATAAQDGTNNVSIPGTPQEGDFVLVITSLDFGGTAVPPDDGSSNYNIIAEGTGDVPCFGLYYKVLGASPETTVNLNGWTGGIGQTNHFIVANFRGVDPSTPLDGVTPTTASGASGDPNAPSITTGTNNAAVVSCGFLDDDNITSCTQSGATDVVFGNAGGSAGATSSTMLGWQIQTTAGALDPAAFVTDGDDQWVAYSIALRELVVTGYGNNVNGVSSGNIAKVNTVETANIAEVIGT